MPKKKDDPERRLQVYIVEAMRKAGHICYCVPNGTHVSNVATRMMLKRSGVMAGVSDLHAILKTGEMIFIEVKIKPNRQSDSQIKFQSIVEGLGYRYFVWYSIDDCIDFLNSL